MMAQRMAVVIGLLIGLAGWGGAALAQPCTLIGECMANGMCTAEGVCEGEPVSGGSCDDFEACTTNDTCVNGECMGTPSSGASCNDFNDCTTNDTCVSGVCMGSNAPVGTDCAGGCGTCQQLAPFPGVPLTCSPKPGSEGQSCDAGFGNCFTATCAVIGGITFCSPQFVQCPSTDQDPCTIDSCNPATGRCENFSNFCGECATCDPQSGACIPGLAPATPTRTPMVGPPTATATLPPATATATVPAATPTATLPRATATMPRPGACVADCDNDGHVTVAEVVLATRIALGLASLEDCQSADFDQNGRVTIDELMRAVQALLGGCLT